MYKNCPKIKKKFYFTKPASKRVISTWNHFIGSKYKIIMKFGQKNGRFCFWQRVRKLLENYGKALFYETYIKESNINRKHLIWSNDKIITKFWAKKWVSLVLGKVHENFLKRKEKSYFTKLASKRVISTGNHLFSPMRI